MPTNFDIKTGDLLVTFTGKSGKIYLDRSARGMSRVDLDVWMVRFIYSRAYITSMSLEPYRNGVRKTERLKLSRTLNLCPALGYKVTKTCSDSNCWYTESAYGNSRTVSYAEYKRYLAFKDNHLKM